MRDTERAEKDRDRKEEKKERLTFLKFNVSSPGCACRDVNSKDYNRLRTVGERNNFPCGISLKNLHGVNLACESFWPVG